MLDALMGGEEQTARSLARAAEVTPPTASSHLRKLLEAGLVTVVRTGRERRYRLAGAEVAEALEALGVLAPAARVRGLKDANRRESLSRARTCYDHLAGRLGVELTAGLVREGCLRGTELRLTRRGEQRMLDLGIDIDGLRKVRRPLTRSCLDWTERKPHLAGALGGALAERFFDQRWIERVTGTRAVRVTERGNAALLSLGLIRA